MMGEIRETFKKMNVIIILFISIISCCVAELFSSSPGLRELMKTENSVVEALERSLEEIDKLRDDLKSYKNKFVYHENITEDFVLKHVSNPINSYTLIKRLYLDLAKLQTIYNEKFENINSKLFNYDGRPLPDKDDLSGIAMLIKELQVGYSLNLTEFANGYIKGIKYGEPLSAKEVYQLGKAICEEKQDNSCISFLKEALRKWDGSEDVSKIEIMRAISDAYYQSENLTASLEWDSRILKEEDADDIVTLLHKAQTLQDLKNGYKPAENLPKSYIEEYERELLENYYALCNGEKKLPEKIKAKLHCFYKYGKNPFLRLAPLKLEQLYYEPDLFMIHQMISDDEINELIKRGGALSRRSRLVVNGIPAPTTTRVSSTARLSINETLPRKIMRRTLDLTELDETENMDLQVTHYPPGGYFQPHFDMVVSWEDFAYEMGNRISTVVHYLSHVEQGGGTAFPLLGVMVEPIKGSAVYWRNLHSSGEADIRAMHGGCPVLHGIKWIANAWVHSNGQVEATPCGLEYLGENYLETSLSKYLEENKK